MRFYRTTGTMTDESSDRKILFEQTQSNHILVRSLDFNTQKQPYCFIADISDNLLIAGIISPDAQPVATLSEAYLKALGFNIGDIRTEEIVLDTMKNMLCSASNKNYIHDDDEVLERFGLDCLYKIDYGENLIASADEKTIRREAERLLIGDTLSSELDRIRAGKSRSKANGHPVHYMIETDDQDTRRELYRLLLSALYGRGRISNRRYSFLDIDNDTWLNRKSYDALYESSIGGAVVVRYCAATSEENDRASVDRETIELLCRTMEKYRNRVLSIFCFPRECTQIKERFGEYWNGVCFVEIKEDLVSNEQAEYFLKRLAGEHHVRTDRKLFSKLEPDRGYRISELRRLFQEWYDRKLRTAVYPQYASLATVGKELAASTPKGNAYTELQEMIGLEDAKQVLNQALNYFKAQKLFAGRGMHEDRPAMHMVFTGNPGTAKTSVARLFARIMKDNGLLSRGNLVECGRGDLVGKFVGWTAPTIQKKFKEAQGGVLFIDEAYSLVDDWNGSYGDEAINTIVQEMENHRSDVVVIFAGYPEPMERFLQKNPGLRSRIAFHVPFADYDTDELCAIAELLAKQKQLRLTDGARSRLQRILNTAKTESDFGNGRYVRNVLEQARMAQASRLLAMDYDTLSEADIRTICEEDIVLPKQLRCLPGRMIGFSA